jgi:hypothetical protein
MGAAEDVEAQGQGFKQVGKDLFAGACGGIAQVLLGQLFFRFFAVFCRGFWSFSVWGCACGLLSCFLTL